VMFVLACTVWAQIEQVQYSFTGSGGFDPRTNLVFGSSGKLYGMATNGGISGNRACGKGGCGVVFELVPRVGANWTYRPIHSFQGGSDGFAPYGNIVFDAAGNLYGTTSGGGANNSGTVFKMIPASGSSWTESVIYSFGASRTDGILPYAGLIEDAAGNLYGTTSSGGATNNGTVFELTPNADGSWSETILYSFLGGNIDGADPLAEVTFDSSGYLYGTTYSGGRNLHGTVFQLIPASGGQWTEKTIYDLSANDLSGPRGPVWLDSSGNVYGTTCGQFNNQGAIFFLRNSAGAWAEKTLHIFGQSGDGACPLSGLTPDATGNLYGTATAGGANGAGIIYEMVRGASGSWTEKVLYSFGSPNDGSSPWAGVTMSAGSLFYGTTTAGGATGFGTFYKFTP
jgi:uncharacterized repeat protein (TIGR03803 family)